MASGEQKGHFSMSPVDNTMRTIEKIFRRVKGLRDQMQPGEEPLLAVPAIWDSGQEQHSTPCEVIVTNQRLLGYYSVSFPRKRLFLEELSLAALTTVSLRHKTYEPLFRELLVSEGHRKIYIRAPRRYIEALFAALRSATEQYVPAAQATFEDKPLENRNDLSPRPVYGRQDIRRSFNRSPLAITLLFVGGIVLEILGFALWGATQSAQTGIPLFVAGLVAVLTATFIRRQRS
jgi:hypothetical protein